MEADSTCATAAAARLFWPKTAVSAGTLAAPDAAAAGAPSTLQQLVEAGVSVGAAAQTATAGLDGPAVLPGECVVRLEVRVADRACCLPDLLTEPVQHPVDERGRRIRHVIRTHQAERNVMVLGNQAINTVLRWY